MIIQTNDLKKKGCIVGYSQFNPKPSGFRLLILLETIKYKRNQVFGFIENTFCYSRAFLLYIQRDSACVKSYDYVFQYTSICGFVIVRLQSSNSVAVQLNVSIKYRDIKWHQIEFHIYFQIKSKGFRNTLDHVIKCEKVP